jgi:hypothetical protein
MSDTPFQVRSARRYMLELTGAMVLYALVLIPAIRWINANPESDLRWIVGLLPLLPTVLAAWTILRFFGRMDELARKKLTEALAFAFAASALLVLTLGFLQTAGLDSLSVWWIWVGMGSMWLVGSAITELRYR